MRPRDRQDARFWRATNTSPARSKAPRHDRAHGAPGRAHGRVIPGHTRGVEGMLREAGSLLPRRASSRRGTSSPPTEAAGT